MFYSNNRWSLLATMLVGGALLSACSLKNDPFLNKDLTIYSPNPVVENESFQKIDLALLLD